MNFNPRHFIRMSKWARKPPSDQRVKLVLAVIALCLVLFALERIVGTPEWMRMENTPAGRIKQ